MYFLLIHVNDSQYKLVFSTWNISTTLYFFYPLINFISINLSYLHILWSKSFALKAGWLQKKKRKEIIMNLLY